MRRFVFAVVPCCVAAAVGCAKSDKQATTDTTVAAASAPAPAPPAAPSLAEQAGTWSGRSMPTDKDTVVATWTLVRTANTAGWTVAFPKGKPIPIRVLSTEGDSEVVEFGPYKDPAPRGQMQTVHAVSRIEGGKRVGTYEVRLVSKPDSVIRGRFEATRAP